MSGRAMERRRDEGTDETQMIINSDCLNLGCVFLTQRNRKIGTKESFIFFLSELISAYLLHLI